jgi:hypothetical protein
MGLLLLPPAAKPAVMMGLRPRGSAGVFWENGFPDKIAATSSSPAIINQEDST